MPDLTPQLRTRLNRTERLVGVFVVVATLLLLGCFAFYLRHTAERKGWFLVKATYWTSTDTAAGIKVGDPVKLWGFNIGEITQINTLPAGELFNVYVEFQVRAPYFGYIWTGGSFAKVNAADFLGNRAVEVTRGNNYIPTYILWEIREYSVREAQALPNLGNYMFVETIRAPRSNTKLAEPPGSATRELLKAIAAAGVSSIRLADRTTERKHITHVWDQKTDSYQPFHKTNLYWLPPLESPALTERLEGVISNVQAALPVVLSLTNQLVEILTNAGALASHADTLLLQAQPLMSNLAGISGKLADPNGSLGQWLIPPNLNAELLTTLTNVNGTLTNASATLTMANTNLVVLMGELNAPMQSLSLIISNLNLQVQANTNFVAEISTLIVHLDDLIQGFKRHWLLRSAFKEKPTNTPPRKAFSPRGTK
jgi:ABC-type transporter Mla subunit MlaD